MKNTLRIALAAVLAPAVLSGCSVTTRYVTMQAWNNPEVLYVAHIESTQSLFSASHVSKVQKCSRRDDNSLDCTEQAQLVGVLNADNSMK